MIVVFKGIFYSRNIKTHKNRGTWCGAIENSLNQSCNTDDAGADYFEAVQSIDMKQHDAPWHQ